MSPIPQGSANFLRSRFVVFALGGRGQRLSDSPYSAGFPGHLTEGIDDSGSYIFRGTAADSVRGMEYLQTRDEVDADRVVAIGNDMALMMAALHDGATHVICQPGLFVDTLKLAARTGDYPLEEINEYLNLHPERKQAVEDTLGYFDLRGFAPRVNAQDAADGGRARQFAGCRGAVGGVRGLSRAMSVCTNRRVRATGTECTRRSGWRADSGSRRRYCRSIGAEALF